MGLLTEERYQMHFAIDTRQLSPQGTLWKVGRNANLSIVKLERETDIIAEHVQRPRLQTIPTHNQPRAGFVRLMPDVVLDDPQVDVYVVPPRRPRRIWADDSVRFLNRAPSMLAGVRARPFISPLLHRAPTPNRANMNVRARQPRVRVSQIRQIRRRIVNHSPETASVRANPTQTQVPPPIISWLNFSTISRSRDYVAVSSPANKEDLKMESSESNA